MIKKKLFCTLLLTFSFSIASAESTFNFSFENADINEVIKEISKKSDLKFIIDPSVRGKITIINKKPVNLNEALNDLATGLAFNGYSLVHSKGKYLVLQARRAARYLSPFSVSNENESEMPIQMMAKIFHLSNLKAYDLSKSLRSFISKDGNIEVLSDENILISDWSTNIKRIGSLIEKLDGN